MKTGNNIGQGIRWAISNIFFSIWQGNIVRGGIITYFMCLICMLLPVMLVAQETTVNSQKSLQATQKMYWERGIPFIQNYGPDDYYAANENHAIAQSKNGLMYFANSEGILEYNGVSWRLIPVPEGSMALSLALGSDNKLYVGLTNDIGYLAPDSIGQLQFISLKDKINPAFKDFQDVGNIHVLNDAVYFHSAKQLMRWENDNFTVWKTRTLFTLSEIIDNRLIMFELGIGLRKLVDDSLQTVFEKVQDLRSLYALYCCDIAPYTETQFLHLSAHRGLFILNGHTLKPFHSQANEYLKKNITAQLMMLPNGWYAIATIRGGLVIIDREGQIVQMLNKEHGLIDNNIFDMFIDHQSGLWLATGNGISRIELMSPNTIYDKRLGIDGRVRGIVRHKGTIYATNDLGIFYLKENSKKLSGSRFTQINGTYEAYALLLTDKALFAAAFSGVHQIVDGRIINTFTARVKDTVANPFVAHSLLRSKVDPNRMYAGVEYFGLLTLKLVNGKWINDGIIYGVDAIPDKMVEDQQGNLWISTSEKGVYRVELASAKTDSVFHHPAVRHFRPDKELREGVLTLFQVKGEPIFKVDNQFYHYNSERDSIMPARNSNKLASNIGLIDLPERITQKVSKVIYHDNNGIIWYGGRDGIIRYDSRIKPKHNESFYVIVSKVLANGDSLIFGGIDIPGCETELPYTFNNLRFDFAAASYDNVAANRYQYYLSGFDQGWSDWTAETHKNYTNLPGGDYTFMVRAKNIYGTVSTTDSYVFAILPPWYRTWWAYCLYLLLLSGLIFGLVKWRSRKLEEEKEALESLVAERTYVVEQQAEQLKELDEVKSRFYANISHEFRTPLTLILGEIGVLEKNNLPKTTRSIYQVMKRNGKRLLTLVNQLLDLSKLEAGTMQLKTVKTELIAFLKPIIAAYESLAESKHITFNFEHKEEPIPIYLDPDKMEQVVHNLLSNAFKFTDEGGTVSLKVAAKEMTDTRYAEINVEDNGPGIAAEKQEHIFDRFYQVDDTATKQKEGTGIGLALAKELTELHHGEINLDSAPGEGARFTVLLPLGKGHLSSDEIVDQSVGEREAKEIIEDQTAQQEALETVADTEVVEDVPQLLVVEDNADMREYIRQILHAHYQVTQATDGAEGWEKAVEEIPDLIISDVMMPEMDGLELCRRLKKDERTSHIPVVLLTAKAGKASKMEGLETRADDYITKPFDADELLILLRNRIEQRKKLRERFSKEVTLQPQDIAITSADEQFLQKATNIVENNIDDFDFNVEGFVEQMHLSSNQVSRKIKALTDQTPVQFIRLMRLKRAAQKIEQQEDTISQIAYSVGFNNLSYFAKCFKEQFGRLPSEYDA